MLFVGKDVISHEDDQPVEGVEDRCRVQWSADSLDIVACVEVVCPRVLFPLVHREEFCARYTNSSDRLCLGGGS